jgi:hypothetical protein
MQRYAAILTNKGFFTDDLFGNMGFTNDRGKVSLIIPRDFCTIAKFMYDNKATVLKQVTYNGKMPTLEQFNKDFPV